VANPFASGSDRIRQTATWMIGALAAVATVMLAGSQLSTIGDLSLSEDFGRLATAAVSALLAVGLVAYTVYVLTQIQMPQEGTLGELREDSRDESSQIALLASNDRGLIAERHSLGDFFDEYDALRTRQFAAQRERDAAQEERNAATTEAEKTAAGERRKKADATYDLVTRQIGVLRPHLVTLAQLSSYLNVKRRFVRYRYHLLGAATAIAVLLVVFAWAANPPAPSAAPGDVLAARPAAGRLLLTDQGREDLEPALGKACASAGQTSRGLAVVALSGSAADGFDLVVLPGGACRKPVRLNVTPKQAVIVPAAEVQLG
jgi:hypothetical protein